MPAANRPSWPWLLALLTGGCLIGCPATRDDVPDTRQKKTEAQALRVLVMDDPEMAAAIERHWRALAQGDVQIKQSPASELTGSEQKRLGVDVVVYPSGMIGELAERELISPISRENLQLGALARSDIFSLVRLREVSWGGQVHAVPLGSPTLTLYYRADLFTALQLTPPTNWTEYLELAKQLSDRAAVGLSADSNTPWYGVAEPLAAGWAGHVLMARAAAAARHRSQYSTLFDYREMRPLIDGPAFVRALEELAETARYGPAQANSMTPHDVRREFLGGRCAMALSWPSRADSTDDPVTTSVNVGFSELPGSEDVFNFRSGRWESRAPDENPQVTLLAIDGRLGSVTRECRQPSAALDFLFWLCGTEFAQRVVAESKHTTLFRSSQLGQAGAWIESQLDEQAAQQYGETVQLAQGRARWLCSIRIPGRAQYLAAMDDAVHTVLAGQSTAEEALKQAAQRWTEITNSLGLERQRNAYMKSVGLEP